MRKIAVANQKGGCGKTTTAINVASFLAAMRRKVLLIDLDPQGHSAIGFGIEPEQTENSIYEVLLGEIPMGRAIRSLRRNLDAVFSDVVLSGFEQVMAGAREREHKLRQILDNIEDRYDYLVIDCPPSVGLLTFNGLLASEEVIIPVDPSSFSLQGIDMLLDTLRIIERKARRQFSIRILPTNVDLRTRFCRRVVKTLRTRFPQKCFETFINACTVVREAASCGKPIVEYDRKCAAFRDYFRLTEEILKEEHKAKARKLVPASFPELSLADVLPKRSQQKKSVWLHVWDELERQKQQI